MYIVRLTFASIILKKIPGHRNFVSDIMNTVALTLIAEELKAISQLTSYKRAMHYVCNVA